MLPIRLMRSSSMVSRAVGVVRMLPALTRTVSSIVINKHHAYPHINLELLQTYLKIYHHLKVPVKCVVGLDDRKSEWPEKFIGYKIGANVQSIRKALKANKVPKEMEKVLDDMGFIRDVREFERKRYLLAFKTYIAKFGHARVPQGFEILKYDESWPELTRGLKLGIILLKIRLEGESHFKEQLRDMGVQVDLVNSSHDFDRKFAALLVYKQIHGHVKVPQLYVVPDDDVRYAEEVRGIRLGLWLSTMRLCRTYSEYRSQLIAAGVEFPTSVSSVSRSTIVDALTAYQTEHGHMNVTPSYVVPVGDVRYPEVLWGELLLPKIRQMKLMNLAKHIGMIDSSKTINNGKNEKRYFTVNIEALEAYKSLYGDLLVPRSYHAGSDGNDKWPQHLLGFNLGRHVKDIRTKLRWNLLPAETVSLLDDLGFVRSAVREQTKSVLQAFETFVGKFGHGRVKQDFKIDENDESWPEVTRGMKLGYVLSRVRKGQHSTIREQLRDMGVQVDLVNSSHDFDRKFAALLVYKQIHGHVKVPQLYVVPDDDVRYAEEVRGIRLGLWLRNVRNKGYYPENRQKLIDAGVMIKSH